VVSPDRWFPGDFAVVTSRDGRAFAGEVEDIDVCTGELTIRGAGQLTAQATPLRGLRGPGPAPGVLSRRHRGSPAGGTVRWRPQRRLAPGHRGAFRPGRPGGLPAGPPW
jgi:hypothetical protein